MRPSSRRKRRGIGHDRWREVRTPNIAALPAIARLGTCESARGTDADRRAKLLIQFAVEGSLSGAYSQYWASLGLVLSKAVLENRSHAVGQPSDKRTLLRVGRGQPVGLRAASLAGLLHGTSVNRAAAVGRESPEPTPAFSLTLSASPMPFGLVRLISTAWLA